MLVKIQKSKIGEAKTICTREKEVKTLVSNGYRKLSLTYRYVAFGQVNRVCRW